MRKTRILLLTALLLAGVMFLSSCGIGGSTLKLKTLLDGATYVDPDPAFSTAAEVADLKNADLEETRGDLALFIAETEVVEQQDVAAADVIDEVAAEIEIYDWRDDVNVRHWLVVGSYSNTENAERAIADIVKRMPDAQCNYFKLGSMFAVAVFGSAEISDCQEYKRAYIKEFPQSWVYTPKRYR